VVIQEEEDLALNAGNTTPSPDEKSGVDAKKAQDSRVFKNMKTMLQMAISHQAIQSGMRMSRAKKGLPGKGKGGQWVNESFSCTTSARYTATGTSGVAAAPGYSLQPNASGVTEAAQWADVFDEARCVGITAHFRCLYKGDGSSTPGGVQGTWIVVYDPSDSAALTNVVTSLVYAQHFGPVQISGSGVNTAVGDAPVYGTLAENRTGYYAKTFKPPLPLAPTAGASAVSEDVGLGWFSTTDVAASVGYIKFYVESAAGYIPIQDLFVVFHMQYRSRT
jgi:hypothetical protein